MLTEPPMSETYISENLNLPFIAPAQAQKHVTHNEAIRVLDAVAQLSLASKTDTAPPVTPSAGVRYFVPTGGAGDWSGQDGKIVAYQDEAWAQYTPQIGWQAYIEDESLFAVFDGTVWDGVEGGGTPDYQNLSLVGINTTADATNKIAIASDASLFTHDGNGHQIKLNKNLAADTACVLYQTGFSGRAEIGLTGDDDFHFKVSPDGSTWKDAITIDKTTGEVSMPFTSSGGGSSPITSIVKSADEVRSNTAVHTDDADLSLPVSANTTYKFEMWIMGSGSTSGDLSLKIVGPAGCSIEYHPHSSVANTVAQDDTTTQQTYAAMRASFYRGVAMIGGTAGDIKLQWAQNVATAASNTIWEGSYMILTELG